MNLRTKIAATDFLNEALQLAAEASAGGHGLLHMADGVFKGTLYLESGRVIAAEIKDQPTVVSLSALQEIIKHKQAAFLYEEGLPPPGLKRINFPFQQLLKDGLQLTESDQKTDRLGSKIDSLAIQTLTNIEAIGNISPEDRLHPKPRADEA
jgi:hypothetical protein